MQVGRRIYTDKKTGLLILDTGECYGDVLETTIEQDFEVYKSLNKRVPETVEIIKLEYGAYAQDFREGWLAGVNPETKELLFSYPEPNQPREPSAPVLQKPLSEQIAMLKQRTEANEAAILALLNFGV